MTTFKDMFMEANNNENKQEPIVWDAEKHDWRNDVVEDEEQTIIANVEKSEETKSNVIGKKIGIVGHGLTGKHATAAILATMMSNDAQVVVMNKPRGMGLTGTESMIKEMDAKIANDILTSPKYSVPAKIEEVEQEVKQRRSYGNGGTPNEWIINKEPVKQIIPSGCQKFVYPDGYECVARNQNNADKKHEKFLSNGR